MKLGSEAKKEIIKTIKQKVENIQQEQVNRSRELIDRVKKQANQVNLNNLKMWLRDAKETDLKVNP